MLGGDLPEEDGVGGIVPDIDIVAVYLLTIDWPGINATPYAAGLPGEAQAVSRGGEEDG